ncbi:MAG: hypothetical protein ACI9BD_001161 [Candidatus Marinamargulisbacteria bacterium]|jgi:hypothetical protein
MTGGIGGLRGLEGQNLHPDVADAAKALVDLSGVVNVLGHTLTAPVKAIDDSADALMALSAAIGNFDSGVSSSVTAEAPPISRGTMFAVRMGALQDELGIHSNAHTAVSSPEDVTGALTVCVESMPIRQPRVPKIGGLVKAHIIQEAQKFSDATFKGQPISGAVKDVMESDVTPKEKADALIEMAQTLPDQGVLLLKNMTRYFDGAPPQRGDDILMGGLKEFLKARVQLGETVPCRNLAPGPSPSGSISENLMRYTDPSQHRANVCGFIDRTHSQMPALVQHLARKDTEAAQSLILDCYDAIEPGSSLGLIFDMDCLHDERLELFQEKFASLGFEPDVQQTELGETHFYKFVRSSESDAALRMTMHVKPGPGCYDRVLNTLYGALDVSAEGVDMFKVSGIIEGQDRPDAIVIYLASDCPTRTMDALHQMAKQCAADCEPSLPGMVAPLRDTVGCGLASQPVITDARPDMGLALFSADILIDTAKQLGGKCGPEAFQRAALQTFEKDGYDTVKPKPERTVATPVVAQRGPHLGSVTGSIYRSIVRAASNRSTQLPILEEDVKWLISHPQDKEAVLAELISYKGKGNLPLEEAKILGTAIKFLKEN